MPGNDIILTAQVILFSSQGRSISSEPQVTSGNINQLAPSDYNVRKAIILLQEMGFVCHPSYLTLAISGPLLLFEKFFNITFEEKNYQKSTYLSPTKKPVVPPSLKDIVADVVFGEPVESFV